MHSTYEYRRACGNQRLWRGFRTWLTPSSKKQESPGFSRGECQEWLGSPIVYRESFLFETVREIAPECFNPVASAHHYHGMAKKHDMRYIRNGNTTKKRYLYAVRALLACRWSILEQRPVPMAFDELKSAMLEPKMVPVVDDLVESKRSGLEKGPCGPILELNDWILAQEEALKAKMDLLEAPKRVSWPVLDEIFLKIVSGTGLKSSF